MGLTESELRQSHLPFDGSYHQVAREVALIFMGASTLLCQLAHPEVAYGVKNHSNFEKYPLSRLWSTVDLVRNQTVFGSREQALEAAKKIRQAHIPVHGIHQGIEYSVNRDNKTWIWSTLIRSGIVGRELFVGPLEDNIKDKFVEEGTGLCVFMGLPRHGLPQTWQQLGDYQEQQIRTEKVKVTDTARELAQTILSPTQSILKEMNPKLEPLAGPLGPLVYHINRVVAVGTLPEELRQQYGYQFTELDRVKLNFFSTAVRLAINCLPPEIRYVPAYHKARERFG